MIELDGTPNKENLGANALLGVSLATGAAAAAAAQSSALSLSRRTERQGVAGADDEHPERRRAFGCADRFPGVHDHAERRAELSRKRFAMARRFSTPQESLEGPRALHCGRRRRRFRAAISSRPNDALESIASAVKNAGYKLGEADFHRARCRVVASSSTRAKALRFQKIDGSKRTAEELVEYYAELCGKFPIISIEDGCAENDWDGWKKLTERLGDKIQLVGDDLFVTNVEFLRKGIDERRGQFDSGQGQPDRHADRNARRHRTRARKQLHRRD